MPKTEGKLPVTSIITDYDNSDNKERVLIIALRSQASTQYMCTITRLKGQEQNCLNN